MERSAGEYEGDLDTDDNVTLSSISLSPQSSAVSESLSQDKISHEEASENVMFEELFGSSGEEDVLKEDNDDVIEGATNDDSDEMEFGEIEHRKVEEEFKRITSHSADVPQTSVSSSTCTQQ